MIRKRRWADLIERQIDLFEREYADVIEETDERLAAYNAAERDEAEGLYGDYIDAVETGTEILADIRDAFKWTLEDELRELYEYEFNAAVMKRLPRFGLEIDLR